MNVHTQIPTLDRPPICPAPAVGVAKVAYDFANGFVDVQSNDDRFHHFIGPDGSRHKITRLQMAEICKRRWGFGKPEFKDAPMDVLFLSVMNDGVA